MNEKNLKKNIYTIFSLIFLAEIFSLFGYLLPQFRQISFLVLAALILALTIKKLEFGILILLAELFIGSKGYLFYLSIGSTKISIRIAIWLIVMTVWAISLIANYINSTNKDTLTKSLGLSFRTIPLFYYFFILFLSIIWGAINGIISHNDFKNIFLDLNGWLYFALLFPLTGYVSKSNLQNLFTVFTSSMAWIILKTYFLLFIFSHNMIGMIFELYRWVRESGVGEITQLGEGFHRIFFQSHIYALFALFSALVLFTENILVKKENRNAIWYILSITTLLSIVILTLSRSFWVGLAAGLFFFYSWLISKHGWKVSLKCAGTLLICLLLSVSVIISIVKFPYPKPLSGSAISALSDRLKSDEAAVSSRWQLLQPLFKNILNSPVLGKGFGTEVTYFSKDPRALEKKSTGEYTTYAFEWGWLDIWLKLGIIGLLAYLFLLAKIFYDGIRSNDLFKLSLAIGILVLCAVNIFTPYLNHPLGIGYLILSALIIKKNE